MTVDLQVVHSQEVVRLDHISVVSPGGIKSIRVRGQDFSSVDEVLINDIASPDVVILSGTELLAQLPDSMQRVPEVNSVVVINHKFTVGARSVLRFRFGKTTGRVKGIQRLVQLFVKVLFTTPGTDIFNPTLGGGILGSLGSTYGKDDGDNVITEYVIAVQRTQRQLIAQQSKDQRSPRDERLLSATVVGSSFDSRQGALYMRVSLVSQAGRTALVNMEL